MTSKILLGLAYALLLGFAPSAHSETVNVSRRLVRFDGKPAAGARVEVLGDYGNFNQKTDFEVIADADGVFSVDVEQKDALWVGHLIIRAEGCALLCEVGVTGRPKNAPWTPVRRLGSPFNILGRTIDTDGHPIAGAKVSLVLAKLASNNDTPLNTATTHSTTTPDLTAHSNSNGVWSMPGIDFVSQDHSMPATAVFEAAGDDPVRACRLSLKLDPDVGSAARQNVPLNCTLAPMIRVSGRVVSFTSGKPIAGVHCLRSEIFTSFAHSSGMTDGAGRFELEIPGPLRSLSFWVYCDGYAEATLKTAIFGQAKSDWADTRNLHIAIRPMVAVSGSLLDTEGEPLDEPVKLAAHYYDKINATWDQECDSEGSESKFGADGSFTAKLPAGRITVVILAPPQQMGSGWGSGASPMHYRLQQQVDIPAEGMTGLRLMATRIDMSKNGTP